MLLHFLGPHMYDSEMVPVNKRGKLMLILNAQPLKNKGWFSFQTLTIVIIQSDIVVHGESSCHDFGWDRDSFLLRGLYDAVWNF